MLTPKVICLSSLPSAHEDHATEHPAAMEITAG